MTDLEIVCVGCGDTFVWTIGEQEWFARVGWARRWSAANHVALRSVRGCGAPRVGDDKAQGPHIGVTVKWMYDRAPQREVW